MGEQPGLEALPRAVFFGSDAIALPLLDWLAGPGAERVHLAAVVTQPDRPHGRGKHLEPGPVKRWARERGVRVWQPEKPGVELVDWMAEAGIHLALVMAYGHILRQRLLDAPALGCWNLHGSILPFYRGASPVETALAEGETQTGITLMRMVLAMDAGPVAGSEPVPIHPGDTAADLRRRVGEAAVPLLERHSGDLLAGSLTCVPQDAAAATYCRKLEKEDGWLDFDLPAEALERRVRACQPWPGAFLEVAGLRLRVGAAEVGAAAEDPPGTIRTAPGRGSLEVATARGWLRLLAVQRPGGKMLPAAEFLRGFSFPEGTRATWAPSKSWVQKSPFSVGRL